MKETQKNHFQLCVVCALVHYLVFDTPQKSLKKKKQNIEKPLSKQGKKKDLNDIAVRVNAFYFLIWPFEMKQKKQK